MLGIAERLAINAGIDWAFCDTDSMAFAKPAHMDDSEFQRQVGEVREWFNVLNPYEIAGDLLKIEDANYAIVGGKPTDRLAPLYVWAVSAKRYALFNIDDTGRPVLRKAIGQAREQIRQAAAAIGQRQLARAAGISRETLAAIIGGRVTPRAETVAKLLRAARSP